MKRPKFETVLFDGGTLQICPWCKAISFVQGMEKVTCDNPIHGERELTLAVRDAELLNDELFAAQSSSDFRYRTYGDKDTEFDFR